MSGTLGLVQTCETTSSSSLHNHPEWVSKQRISEYFPDNNPESSVKTLQYPDVSLDRLLKKDEEKIIAFPPEERKPLIKSKSLQKWEGVVLEVYEDTFLTRLYDLTKNGPDEEAEIYKSELDKEDLEKRLRPGAVFYWNIGYTDSPTGRVKESLIRFRMLPRWNQKEIEAAEKKAEEIGELLNWK